MLSGRLTELSGPGGLNAKFRQASGQPADVAAIEVSEAPLGVGKASLADLETWLKTSAPDRSRPVLLSLVEGRAYEGPVFGSYLQRLRNEFPRLVFVTVLDREGKLVVHYPASVLCAWDNSSTPYLIVTGQVYQDPVAARTVASVDLLPGSANVHFSSVTAARARIYT